MRRRGPYGRWLAGLSVGLLVGLANGPARAGGLNIERLRLNPAKDGVAANVDLTVAYGQGNVNAIDLATEGTVAYRRARHLVFLLGSSNYSTRTRNEDGKGVAELLEKSSRFTDRHHAHLRYNYRFLPWLRAEAFTQLQRDAFLRVDLRTKHGAGLRFTPYNNGKFGAHFGAAYMFDHEKLDEDRLIRAPRGGALNFAHRLSSYGTLSLQVDRFAAHTTTYVQPRWDRWRDFQVLHETEFSVDITQHFALKLAMNLRWDSRPPVFCSADLDVSGACAGDGAREVQVRPYDLRVSNAFSFSF